MEKKLMFELHVPTNTAVLPRHWELNAYDYNGIKYLKLREKIHSVHISACSAHQCTVYTQCRLFCSHWNCRFYGFHHYCGLWDIVLCAQVCRFCSSGIMRHEIHYDGIYSISLQLIHFNSISILSNWFIFHGNLAIWRYCRWFYLNLSDVYRFVKMCILICYFEYRHDLKHDLITVILSLIKLCNF